MRRRTIALLTAIMLMLSAASFASALDGREWYTVTFFTTTYMIRFPCEYKYRDSVKMSFSAGHVLEPCDIPYTAMFLYGDGFSCAWDTDPVGVTVTQDMEFEAYVAGDTEDYHPVHYYGTPMCVPGFTDPQWHVCDITIGYPESYILSEEDLPKRPALPPGGEFDDCHLECVPDPVGVEVTGPLEFRAEVVLNSTFTIIFVDPLALCDEEYLAYHVDVPYGAYVEPPEPPENEGYVFTGWNSDLYQCVVRSDYIMACQFEVGDVNTDYGVDSGDAAYMLRYSVGLVSPDVLNFDRLSDFNHDGLSDTGDAVSLLRAAVGMRVG